MEGELPYRGVVSLRRLPQEVHTRLGTDVYVLREHAGASHEGPTSLGLLALSRDARGAYQRHSPQLHVN